MKHSNIIRTLNLLLLAGVTTFVSCNKEDDDQPAASKTYTMTVNATKGDRNTKALGFDGEGNITATWTENEEVTVYNVTKNVALTGTLKAQSSGTSTTLKGTLTGDIDATDVLKLMFLSPSYGTQDGTLTGNATSIDRVCDYAEATVTVASVSGGNITTSDANFVNQQAIVKFTLKDNANDANLSATLLTVGIESNSYTVTPTSATNVLYVAIPAISSKTVTLIATDGDNYYYYQKTGVSFSNSQYYAIEVKMEETDLARPLTFEAKTAGATVTFTKGSSFTGKVQCSTDGGRTWSDYSSAITLSNVGDKVLFRGNNSAYYNGSASKFSCGQDCYIYGNIMSLVSSTGYPTTPSAGGSAFRELFAGNTHIKSHATKKLCLALKKVDTKSQQR